MSTLTNSYAKDERKVLRKMYFRSWSYGLLFCYSRLCGNAFMYALYPFINWLYPKPEDKEKKIEALLRHNSFFNNHAVFFPLCSALIAAMEKQRAEDENFDPASIEAVKASLIGPLSAIGDTLFWITWRVITIGIGLQFALRGSILGPLLFLVLYNIPSLWMNYYFYYRGYKFGTGFLAKASESGILQKIINAVSMAGLIMVGGMVANFVHVPLIATFGMEGVQQPVTDIFNGIFPGFLELALALLVVFILKKKVNAIWIVLAIFAISILGALVGIF